MRTFFALLALCASTVASAQSLPENLVPSSASPVRSNLPAAPSGRSTVMGGEIEKVDGVRDQLRLKVPGGHTVTVLFDERTQAYQNGKKISVLSLHPEDHASIETVLDGTAIFALRIHLLSDLPDGHLRGQVVRYDPIAGELKMRVDQSNQAVTVRAATGTPIQRVGQVSFTQQPGGPADLVAGSVVDVTFKSGKAGPGIATSVNVLAVPGSEFMIRGSLSFLDLRAGRMTIAESPDHSIDVSFDASHFPVSHELHEGLTLRLATRFDGSRYVATQIAVE